MSLMTPSIRPVDVWTVGALAIQVSDLAQRVKRLESDAGAMAATDVAAETIKQVRLLTERLFPGPISVRLGWDPEDTQQRWIVFDVEARGKYADFRDREQSWYEEVAKICIDGQPDLRLCVMPIS